MLEKVRDNMGKLTPLCSVVAAALLVPTILSYLFYDPTEVHLVTLATYLVLLVACVLLCLPKADSRILLPISHSLFYGALAFRFIYDALTGDISNYAFALLYGAMVVLFFIPSGKKGHQVITLVSLAFFLASVLGGSVIGLSRLLFALVLAANLYFNSKKES